MRKAVVLVLIGCLCLALAAHAQEKAKPAVKQEGAAPPAKGAPQMTPEQKAMMEKMEKAATPGPEHKFLASLEGAWNGEIKWWEDPKAPPQVSKGTGENKMILGGRFLQQAWKGSTDMGPFEGFGYWGFDNVQKKFQGTWMDSMGTGMMVGTGELDKSGMVLTSEQKFADPMTGLVQSYRSVIKVVDANKHIMEMYGKGKDGKEFLMMEITYTRAGAATPALHKPKPKQ
jgi:hypothetical protein